MITDQNVPDTTLWRSPRGVGYRVMIVLTLVWMLGVCAGLQQIGIEGDAVCGASRKNCGSSL